MQFRLRTLLIVLAVGPVVLWACWALWPRADEMRLWKEEYERLRDKDQLPQHTPRGGII